MQNPHDKVSIEFMGKTYRVSKDTTLLGALMEVGWDSVKGLGCLGGCCGACAVLYRPPGEPVVKAGLACQTPVQDGLSFSFAGQYYSPKATYNVSELADPEQALFELYPEVTTCRNCELCARVCPQGIDPMKGVWHAVFGNFAAVADLFKSCVQCGLCARVCAVGIRPFLVAIYASRAQGARLTERPPDLLGRLVQIQSGAYEREWQAVLQNQVPATDQEVSS